MLVRRIAVMLALGLWLGGLTLYGLVVIPAGREVLGSAVAQGFVTQVVAARLNVLGGIALAVLAWNTLHARTRPLVIAWLVIAAAQVALFLLHPYVSALVDPATHQVAAGFYARHRIYLLITTAQWLAALAYLGFALARWRADDRA